MDIEKMIEDMEASFVEQFAQMNPETEFLIATSNLLQNGMEVLIGLPGYRIDTKNIANSVGLFDSALVQNRWCKVSNLKKTDNNRYSFMGTYEDGTQRVRITRTDIPWLVKLSSVDVFKNTRDAVRELVNNAMIEQDIASCANNGCNSTLVEVLESTTESILQIFGMGVKK